MNQQNLMFLLQSDVALLAVFCCFREAYKMSMCKVVLFEPRADHSVLRCKVFIVEIRAC